MTKRTVLALLALVTAVWPAPASAGSVRGSFIVVCDYSHTLPDDPIVAPGVRGGSHLHDFFGNRTTNAKSTLRSMRKGTTTCEQQLDTAGYWNPTAYLGGRAIAPETTFNYYYGVADLSVRSYPAGIKLLAGNKNATSGTQNPWVRWDCGPDSPMTTHPYNCALYGGKLSARVEFPSCWNGRSLKPNSLTYPVNKQCPSTFPHRLPLLDYQVRWPIQDPCLGAVPCTHDLAPDANIKLSLSSGPYYTMHADFWNTWQQTKLDTLVNDCLNTDTRCGQIT